MSRLTRDETAEPVSRDQILRHARGQENIHFPCSADHEQDWQPYPVDPYSAICDDHTYINTHSTYIHQGKREILKFLLHFEGWVFVCYVLTHGLIEQTRTPRVVSRYCTAVFHTRSSSQMFLHVLTRRYFQHALYVSMMGVGKRGANYLVHGDLPRQHSFENTLRFTGLEPEDSRQ